MKGLTTDTGQNAKGFLYLLATPVVIMPDSMTRTVLIVALLVVFAFVSWLTRGNLHPEIADAIAERVEDEKSNEEQLREARIEEVLRRGRLK